MWFGVKNCSNYVKKDIISCKTYFDRFNATGSPFLKDFIVNIKDNEDFSIFIKLSLNIVDFMTIKEIMKKLKSISIAI